MFRAGDRVYFTWFADGRDCVYRILRAGPDGVTVSIPWHGETIIYTLRTAMFRALGPRLAGEGGMHDTDRD